MDGEVIRYLYDRDTGGGAQAFKCLLPGKGLKMQCGAVCRTLQGMRMHQRIVHRFEPQEVLLEIFDPGIEVNPIPRNGKSESE
jgi:hypothetical protein